MSLPCSSALVFPVCVSLGLYRDGMGNGKKLGCSLLKQVALGLFGDDSLIAEFAQGGAERGGAHGAEFAQVLEGDGLIRLRQSVADALGGRFLRRRSSGTLLDLLGMNQRQGEGGVFPSELAMFMSRRRLPAACSQRVRTSGGVISFGLPAAAQRWLRHSASSLGLRASRRRRLRMRLAMGYSPLPSRRWLRR